jgi:hypothetical protein
MLPATTTANLELSWCVDGNGIPTLYSPNSTIPTLLSHPFHLPLKQHPRHPGPFFCLSLNHADVNGARNENTRRRVNDATTEAVSQASLMKCGCNQ